MVVGDVTTAVDVLVLGGGPAGYVAAIRAAQLGRQVTLVDPVPPGGTCLHRGCIPLKALLTASERYAELRRETLEPLGIRLIGVDFDWGRLQAWKASIVARLAEGVRRLLAGNRVQYVAGRAWFLSPEEVRVESEQGERFKFEHCLIAVGAEAEPPPGLDYDGRTVLTPEQALELAELPETLAVAGTDYVALELTTLFARLGVRVQLCLPGEELLPGIERAALRPLQAGLRQLGVQVIGNLPPERVETRPLVVCGGLRPRTAGLQLEAAGVSCDARGAVRVSPSLQTSVARIYAAGDCAAAGAPPLASVAIKQGKVAAEALCGRRVQFAPLALPRVVLTSPELASVGYTAPEAERAGYRVKTGRFPLGANGRALMLGGEAGMVLVVANAEDESILGMTIVGPRAGELITTGVLAIEMGATLTDLAELLYAHPGLAEGLLESAEGALGQAIHVLGRATSG
ncbi:dihydrolipoyl dehydrogenase family protein [Thermogemmatispora sp.]|uniref:dihydrolipoyl dehydrogenase family protein n=1 Tax=Thermogemmatispora sp. TaxID=1968838 RepID=UPI001DF6D6F2|nr:FAD-dependent oxidoreductase [Thermogemmatispora sp.]MBX5448753.1 FAD-dependent oxidoreductase [Thermogemmatispora sp.]